MDSTIEETQASSPKKSCCAKLRDQLPKEIGPVIKTFCLFFCMLNFGLQQEIIGPSVPTFVNQTHSDYQKFGVALGCKSIGYLVGAFFGGSISDRLFSFKRDFALCLAMLSTVVEFFLISYVVNIFQISFILFTVGMSHSIIGSIVNVNLSELWHGNSGPAFNFIYTGLGFGAIIAAVIVKDYILEEPEGSNAGHGQISLSEPFMITSYLTLVAAFWVFLHFAIGIVEDRKKTLSTYSKKLDKEKKSEKKAEIGDNKCSYYCSQFSKIFVPKFEIEEGTLAIVVMVPFIIFFLYGIERVIGGYMFSYLVESQTKFTSKKALFTVYLFWIAFTVSRIIFFFLSSFVQVSYLFLASAIGAIGSFIALATITNQEVSVNITIFFIGIFFGNLFPCFIATTDQVTRISGTIVMLLEIGGGLGSVTLNNIIGFVMSTGLRDYYPLALTITCIGLVLFAIIFVILVEKLKRTQRQ